ncbi:DUF885 family protein [Sediminibacterium ginsengisoli]|uniref:Uncharacterized conserved protein, DUF885 familyt n=1 Tax=Sediminibacterium ginsengisoli TaxID=413434 RepID=A0A1T4PIB2_9BACT|nr:DUF885 family protein [Sediminibacterium ginsengisoli]SJZ91151.1 Uncharacterized conserved protein, DUF885 familyt [Sediminibacterium ginsengisoli]
MRTNLCLLLLLCLLTSQSRSQDKSKDIYYQTSAIQPYIAQYDADRGSLGRFYTILNSPERRNRFISFYKSNLQQLAALNFDQLKTDAQVDYILFKRQLENELRLLDKEEKEYKQIYPYVSFADNIYEWEKQRRRGTYLPSEQIAGRMNAMLKELNTQSAALTTAQEMEMPLAIRAEATVRGLQNALRSVYQFYNGYDPAFSKWIPAPYKSLDSAFTVYALQLRNKGTKPASQKDDGSGIIGNPIGREELIRQLQYEMIPYSPEELVDIANKEFAWCDAEMLKASKEMGFGNDWKAALEKVKNTYVPEGKQPEMIMGLYHQSVDFIKKNDMVTIPPLAEETWRMIMMSANQQLVSPFFLGGEVLQIAYPVTGMDSATRMMSMRGNNPHFSRATVHHELIAGHHLQGFMNNRYKSYRNFNTPFWTEGWALYWEFLLWDAKFPRSPEDRIGMLFWRMHRCARIIFSLNYHLGKWTPQQCINFLVDRVGHERANAEGEVRRSFTGNYGPLYQLAYMTGAFQFYALKKELVDGGKMSLKTFNDAILRESSMPVEMVRATLLKKPLKRDFVTSWRFYDK